MTPQAALAQLWQLAGLPAEALAFAHLTGHDPVFPSSFAVGTAAQSTVAAAALASCEWAHERGAPRQSVTVDMAHACAESTAWMSLDGRVPQAWDPFSGLYRASDGWVRVHANFRHHRDGALRLLGLDPSTATREDAEAALAKWKALEFEEAAASRSLVVSALRTFDEWDRSPQGQAVAAQPLFTIERIADSAANGARTAVSPDGPADGPHHSAALPQGPGQSPDAPPLDGLRVLDLTRILAGPVGGRTLAAYGADVMLVNSPNLPNIEHIADSSRGKRSCHVDLRTESGRADMDALVQGAHVFVQGYRPGGLEALGYGPEQAAALRPGIVYVSLSAYGNVGPWAGRRGFDSLVQTAMGFNHAEGVAAGEGKPRALPMQILDMATGFLIAFCVSAALIRQRREGGSWHVRLSLAQTGHWLRSLGRVDGGLAVKAPSLEPWLETVDSGFGKLRAVTHAAQLGRTPAKWKRMSVPPGNSRPHW